jgi:hypothetical protein
MFSVHGKFLRVWSFNEQWSQCALTVACVGAAFGGVSTGDGLGEVLAKNTSIAASTEVPAKP